MTLRILALLVALGGLSGLSACVPVAIGAGAAVGADTLAEQDGDDGLF